MIGHIVIIALLAGIGILLVRISRTLEDLSHDLRRKTDAKADMKRSDE